MNGEQLSEGVVMPVLRAATRWAAQPAGLGTVLWCAVALGLWLAVKGIARIPAHYKAVGRLECQQATSSATAVAVSHQASAVVAEAASGVARAQAIGTSAERSKARITHHFNRLEKEARLDPPNPVDACVLPADRLRRWAAANAGPFESASSAIGAAASQPDAGPADVAHAGLGAHQGSGSGSQGSRPSLPPGSQPALPLAQPPGDGTQ